MHLIIKLIISLGVLFMFVSCGDDPSVQNETELSHRTATIVTLQQDVVHIIQSLVSIRNEHGEKYTMACNNGGEVDYSFSELVFPVTLSYNNCSTVKVHADNNSAASLKNGVLKISGSEINATITFQGDFNNTVVTNDDKSFETIVSGTSVINSRNVSTYTNRYENIVNISIVANGTTFETNNATYGLTYSDDLLNVVGYTGTVISSIGERISIAMWRTRVTYPPKVVRLNREGDFIDGSLLYKYGSSHTEIFVSDINTFKLNERSIENISAYLW